MPFYLQNYSSLLGPLELQAFATAEKVARTTVLQRR